MAGYVCLLVLDCVIQSFSEALLIALLLGFSWNMLADGMREMYKYALIYGVLCGLNLMFEALPLVSELSGKVSRSYELESATPYQSNSRGSQMVYRTVTVITPFFDASMGFQYNAESVAEVLTVSLTAFGCYLACSAHADIEQQMSDEHPEAFTGTDWVENPTDFLGTDPEEYGNQQRLRQAVRTAARQAESRPNVEDSSEASSTRQCERDYHHFHGKSYKLDS
eukprot:CAMPEP_0197653344 /NCGR_PEP_ID=MMETSP1338-20131121/35142_1 /TAXON_ID=43686 ORGANISM="Pelagodinium beii, Strain RCC1491" /NCGR_SAMPLE_ID=MMETSP1338 /ASSEMBLY_ACC=CAM_ASM_000754 /LENGTH=223 /DNA_ID=CAMNT_0043228415 /DNA_START=158 /DNA_END=829 /DNA_ORIENTATION=-